MEESIVILLVEDDPDHTILIEEALTLNGPSIDVKVVNDGQSALDYLFNQGEFEDKEKSPPPHLILLDIKLPKVNGLDVLKKIKADARLKQIPTVMLTTSTKTEEINQSYEFGADGYISKPFNFNEFRQKLNTLKDYLVEAAQSSLY